ncbi:MAG: nucleotidyltransferase domain-containing protein, partial [Candidatus Muirbacterium halophilum]|nr:nucleotidyltransferase domain-containing protein [Candidatus Muirbacterium halophilum]
YIQPLEDILTFGYVEQVSDEKNDLVYYEVRRFLELISTNNPNILELLNLPDECIVYKHPVYDLILENGDKFISKICKNSFAGYAIAQIKKARGLNKKIVNPVAKEKRNPLDFCYVIEGHSTYPLNKWLDDNDLEQKFCGIVNVPNARDIYALYYDRYSHNAFSELSEIEDIEYYKEQCIEQKKFLHYKGIVKEHEDGNFPSNQLRLSSIPKSEESICIFSFNQDGYTKYCKDYKEYWDWVEKRNEHRYNDNAKHGKGYDSKNMMHCHRLLDMAIEIGSGKGINVRRPNRDYLMNIRAGEMDYDVLVSDAERKIEQVDEMFEKSNLQDKVSSEFVNDLLLKIRKEFYNL